MKLIKIALILLIISLYSCASINKKPEVIIKQVEKPKLDLNYPDPLTLNSIKWIIITEENYNQIFEEMKNKQGIIFFIALDEDGYKALALNNTKLLQYIKEQKIIIRAYKKYYE